MTPFYIQWVIVKTTAVEQNSECPWAAREEHPNGLAYGTFEQNI